MLDAVLSYTRKKEDNSMDEEELIKTVPQTQKKRDMQMIYFRANKSVIRKFKAHCAFRGISMQTVLETLLMDYLKEEKKWIGYKS